MSTRRGSPEEERDATIWERAEVFQGLPQKG